MTINVREKIGTPSAITQESGELIYSCICAAIEANQEIVLDFGEIENIITPFLNNSIGKLYGKYNSSEIQKYLKFKNYPAEKVVALNMVITNAKRFYADRNSYNKVINGVLNDE